MTLRERIVAALRKAAVGDHSMLECRILADEVEALKSEAADLAAEPERPSWEALMELWKAAKHTEAMRGRSTAALCAALARCDREARGEGKGETT